MKVEINGWVIGDKYWKKSHKGFYCILVRPDRQREDRRLDADANKAEELRAGIIMQAKQEGTPSPDYKVRDLIDRFLDQSEANNARKTYIWYRTYLESLCETLPP